MFSRSSVVVFATLVALVLCQGSDLATAPFIVVTKTVSEYYVVVGESVEVSIQVTNYGEGPAFDLVVSDPQGGQTPAKENKVEKLEAGSSFYMNYTTVAGVLGDMAVQKAEVTYTLQSGDLTQLKATSNTIREEEAYFLGENRGDAILNRGTISVVTREAYDRLHTKYIKETIGYLFVGAISVLFPFFMYRTKQNQVDQLIRQAKKKI